MKLFRETHALITQVEAITDRPIQVVEASDLSVMAKIKIASEGAPSHVLAVRPDGDILDYQVAVQCVHVLRLYQRPPSERFHFGSDRKNVSAVTAMMGGAAAPEADDATIRAFAQIVFDWLMLSLRSYPVAMRIDAWLWKEFPALRPQIELGLRRQMQENISAATKDLDGFSVPPLFLALPAAYARFTDRLLGSQYYVIPFESMSATVEGDTLLEIWDRMPDTPLADNKLIDAWAERLGIRGWYVWVPFHE